MLTIKVNYFKVFTILIFLALVTTHSFARETYEIRINKKERILAAPKGQIYQWYYNGNPLIEETEQELQHIHNSGLYSVEFIAENGKAQRRDIFIVASAAGIRKIFLIGDSTVANYKVSQYPMTGWGQVLQPFINSEQFIIDNRAIGGRSSRSFWEEGRWDEVKAAMSTGDFLLIQFGHNDRDYSKPARYTPPADYKNYLKIYVNEARAMGVIPVLVTPMVMNAWRNGVLRNVFTESGAEYVQTMKEVATELNVPLIDLNQKSWDFVSQVGVEYATRFIYNTYPAGEYPNYPDGLNDGTHFQEMGAIQMAKFVAEGINELSQHADVKDISAALMPQYPITVSANVQGAGIITLSQSYPAGLTITLKTLVNSGHQFLNWKESGTSVSQNTIYTFFMGSSPRQFTAYFDQEDVGIPDCAGISGGTAILDNCGICTGGTTGITACTEALQGEDACSIDGIMLESSNEGFWGQGYANTTNITGAYLQFALSASQTGTITLRFRNANGGASNRDAKLKVNGADVGNITFPATGAWTNWQSSEISIVLDQGINELMLEATTDGGLPNIDLVAWSDENVHASTCVITSIKKLNSDYNIFYPNPFSHSMHLSHTGPFEYAVYDFAGNLLDKGICNEACDIGNDLDNGSFLIEIRGEDGIQRSKIIKQ